MSGPSGPEVAAVRQGEELDWVALERYLRSMDASLTGPMTVQQFQKGAANLTYKIQFGDVSLVVRRPPFGRLAAGAHDMAREYRALSRLWQGYPPAPRALAFCADIQVIGAPFLVLEYRAGFGVWGAVPEPLARFTAAGRRIGLAAVDALADLHSVDARACGLGELGRPDGFLERQVDGWRQRWRQVAPPGGAHPADAAGQELAHTRPNSAGAAILHNDFKLDNCQFGPDDPDHVRSVFDWDMATLGDPLVDLGTLLNYWPDPADRPDNRGMVVPGLEQLGLPSHAEVISRYAARTGADTVGIGWHHAFSTWKTAVVLQQLYDRHLRGETSDRRMAHMGARVQQLAERSLELLRH
jgi:aminoglycoside phosphotransferase (APT) family kinase protein